MVAARLDGATLRAPALLDHELANVCLIKGRRHPERRDALAAAFRLRNRLRVEIIAVDHDDVLALAHAVGLTAYDASYLWLARLLDAELVTLDRQLGEADATSRGQMQGEAKITGRPDDKFQREASRNRV